MRALNNECAREAVNFIYKHGDLTYGSAYDAIQLLTSNGFAIYRTDGDEQVVYTDPDGKVWHPHRGYWCWKVSNELAQAQKRIKELEAEPAPADRSGAVKVVEDTYERYPKIMDRLATLEPAEQAEPVSWKAADLIKATERKPGEPSPFTRPEERYAAEPAPAARSGAVKVDDSLLNALRLSGRVSFDEFKQTVLRALEPAEPATDAEPYTYFYRYSDPMSGKPVWRSSGGLWNGQRPSETLPLYTRPPESRQREALEKLLACPAIADENHNDASWGCPETAAAISFARAALAQENGR